jgi:hypothetical protein
MSVLAACNIPDRGGIVMRWVEVRMATSRSDATASPWTTAREGIVYYPRTAKPILATAIRVVILERALSVLMWIARGPGRGHQRDAAGHGS